MREKKGQITVFFSLIIVLVLSVLGAVTEIARQQAADIHIKGVLERSVDSVFAEYDKDMLEEFDLFFIDASYGRSVFSEWSLVERLEYYIAFNINDTLGLPVLQNTDLWKFSHTDTGIECLVMATDDMGTAFRQQASAHMKQNIGSTVLQHLQEYTGMGSQAEDAQMYVEETEKGNTEEWKVFEETVEQEQGEPVEIEENPVDEVDKLRKLSILNLVMEDAASVSGQKTERNTMPSGRERFSGYGQTAGGITEESTLLFCEYLLQYMGNVRAVSENRYLQYELEYIIGGHESDIKNLEAVVNRILFLREGMNFAYLMTDNTKKAEAYAVAAALTASVPGLTSIVQKALLLAWAYCESIVDTRALLAGRKVPFIKTKESWKTDLQGMASLAKNEDAGDSDRSGMGYSDYLRILLLAGSVEQQSMRALDMIEGRLQRKKVSGNFRVDWCVSGVEFYTQWDKGAVFSELPFLQEDMAGELQLRKYRQYE